MKFWKGFLFVLAFFVGYQTVGAYTDSTATEMPGDLQVTDLKLAGNDITDSNETVRISVGSTNAITGNLTISGTLAVTGATTQTGAMTVSSMTVTVAFVLPNHATPDASVTPFATGQIIINTGATPDEVCMSTGVAASSWVLLSTPTVACSN